MSSGELFARALALHRQGNLAAAEQLYRQIVDADPTHADAWHLLGVALAARREYAQAEQLILRAIGLNPQSDAYYHNLGEAYRQAGSFERAIASYQHSLKLQPNSAETWACLGEAFRRRQQFEFAYDHCRQALVVDPNHRVALLNMANVLRDLGKGEAALDTFEKVLELDPNSAEALCGSAALLMADYRYDEAAEHYRRVLAHDPRHAIAWTGLAAVRQTQGDLVSAHESYAKALASDPNEPTARENRLVLLNYDPGVSPEQLDAEHRAWGAPWASLAQSRHANRPDPDRPLRLGYVSPDFRRHPVASFIEPVLRNHDTNRVRVVLYAHQPADDEVTGRLRNCGWTWRRIYGQDDETVARQVQFDEIDILVDLSGHTAHNRLGVFARKPAPIQITWLGYPSTVGLAAIDYRLTDSILDPPGEPALGCETLVRLPGCFCAFQPPAGPDVSASPASKRGYVTFGSLHHLAKLNDQVLDLWAEVLRQTPRSRLFIARHSLVGSARERLLWRLTSRGIDGKRLQWRADYLPTLNHLSFYDDIDISLDPFPWSGHATCCESLWMGVPVMTLLGNRSAGRMAASVLTAAGCEAWIARDRQDYLTLANQLADDVDALAAVRAGLRQRVGGSALCDGRSFTRMLEETYRQIWHAWCRR